MRAISLIRIEGVTHPSKTYCHSWNRSSASLTDSSINNFILTLSSLLNAFGNLQVLESMLHLISYPSLPLRKNPTFGQFNLNPTRLQTSIKKSFPLHLNALSLKTNQNSMKKSTKWQKKRDKWNLKKKCSIMDSKHPS